MAEDGATLTIITPAYNQVSFLAGVVQNVREQAGGGVQHIVVDGGSTDGSVEFLRSMGDAITWVSEPDRGQAHAINKGMALAQGEVVGWINCDDRYTPGALAFVRRMFARQPTLEFLYGDALGTDVRGRSYGLRSHVRQCDLADLINDGDPIVQPAAFWRRELGEVLGELDESLTYAFDYEFWMRAAERTTLEYVPVCLAVECHHGDAKTSRGAHVRMAEIEEAARRHGGSGIPWGFRSEAAALIASAALGSAARGHPGQARSRLMSAAALRADRARFVAHSAAMLIPGDGALPRLRLLANRHRGDREPVFPLQTPLMRDAPAGSRIRPEVSPPGVVDRLARIPLSVASTAAGLARQRLVRPLDLRQYAARPMGRTPADRRLVQRRTSSLTPTLPSISLVMPSLNQGAFLDQAIRSIFQQEYERLEVAVQDGGSTDASLAVLERYASALTSVRSAPDGGQADAINRGFASTDGEIMGWLNSDDLLLPGALMTIGEYFAAHPEVDVVYGNRVVIDETGREVGRWVLPSDTHEYLDWADYIPQETLYWRRSLWSAVGSRLDADVSFALDWELLLRFRDAGARFAHIPTYLGAFRVHEGSKTVSQVDGAGAADMDGIRRARHGRIVAASEVSSTLVPLYLKAGVERGRSRMRTGARWVRSPAIGQRP